MESEKLDFSVIESPGTNEQGLPSETEKHFQFSLEIGNFRFSSAWFFGDKDFFESKKEQLKRTFIAMGIKLSTEY